MQRLIGYWSWNLGEQALVRDDGARLRYIEPVDDDTDPRSRWFRFLVSCDQGETPLLVQHRLAGFNGQYRELYWRADFSRGPAPSSFAQWAAFERIAADGLACWPEETFGELPDYVAVEGGWSDGAFRTDWYRIYERTRVQSFLLQGRLPERDTVERHWRFQPLNPAISAPSPSEVARWHSLQDIRHGLALMIDRGPALVCKDRAILLEEDEYKRLHATYIDDDFVSDRYVITGLYRTQEDRWGVGDYATVAIGARRLRDFRAAEEDGPSGLFGLLSEEPKRDGQGTENWAADPLLVERAAQSFAAALFKVPEGAFSPERASAPPLLIALTQGGFQAGYLQQRLQIARSLGTDEFVAAFANEVPPSATIQLKPGLDFDAETARLRWGDRVLAFERTLEPGPSGARLLLRCSDGDMSWPIVIQQSRHRHHELRAWSVDHDVSLAQWRREEGGDLPDPDQWDCMRQFVEDAILSWPDCPATGYAPQQLITSGGYYDGEWRGTELVRTLGRPYHFSEFPPGQDPEEKVYKPERHAITGPWTDYRPQQRWQRIDELPIDLRERNYSDRAYVYSGGGTEGPIPFAKSQVNGPGHVAASVFSVSTHREEAHRVDYVDFTDGARRLRFGGVRSSFWIGGLWQLEENSVREGKWRPPSAPLSPDLITWRILRDAGESGLRPGESVRITGAWIFQRFFGDAQRSTEMLLKQSGVERITSRN